MREQPGPTAPATGTDRTGNVRKRRGLAAVSAVLLAAGPEQESRHLRPAPDKRHRLP